jgi:hypothetical protein
MPGIWQASHTKAATSRRTPKRTALSNWFFSNLLVGASEGKVLMLKIQA